MEKKNGNAVDLDSSIDRLREVGKGENVVPIPVDKIKPNPYQPRKVFDQEALQQLAQDIKDNTLLEPIIVRRFSSESSDVLFELIAGERRWRAHIIAGLSTINSIIREYDEHQTKRVGLVENIQRENLNAIETAYGIRMLRDDYVKEGANNGGIYEKSLREKIAKEISKDPKTVERYLRIYNAVALIPDVETLLLDNSDRVSFNDSLKFAPVAEKFRGLKKSNNREYERILRRIGKEFADKKNKDAFGKVVDYLLRYFNKDKSCDSGKKREASTAIIPFFQESDTSLILNIGIVKDSVGGTDIKQINEAFSAFMDRLTALIQPGSEH